MVPPALPYELIENIVDEVGYADDTATLKSCALAAFAFSTPAQRHLFRRIDFDRRLPRKKYYQRFHRLVTSKPHLGSYVRDLHLVDDSDDEQARKFSNIGNGTWMLSAKTLSQTLLLLPRLEAFSLTFGADITDWNTIPSATRSAFDRIFQLPTLTSVKLEFIQNFPSALLFSLTRIPHLFLSCVEVAPFIISKNIPSNSPSPRHQGEIQSLFLRGTPASTIDVIADSLKVSLPRLQRLSVTPTYESGFCEAVNEVVRLTGPSLAAFEWLPSVHFATSSAPIDISDVPNLTFLRFVVSFRRSQGNGSFAEVLRLLDQVSSEPVRYNRVETVILDCYCMRKKVDSRSFQAGWEQLEKTLARDAFQSLKEVRVMMSLTDSEGFNSQFSALLDNMFPSLRSRGVVISLEDHDDRKIFSFSGSSSYF